MRAKPDLVPDCDVHGKPMCRVQSSGSALGLGHRDIYVWRCAQQGCSRYFYGTVGYGPSDHEDNKALRCLREGAYLVAQRDLGVYICPVDGCSTAQPWPARKLCRQDVASISSGGSEDFDAGLVGAGQAVRMLSR